MNWKGPTPQIEAGNKHQNWQNPRFFLILPELFRYFTAEYQKAIEFHQQSLTIERSIGDRRGEANSLYNLSLVYHKLGRAKEGFAAGYQAQVIMQELDVTLDAMFYPQWLKSSIKFAQRGWLQLALCFVLGVVAFPFALVWLLGLMLWRVVRGWFRGRG